MDARLRGVSLVNTFNTNQLHPFSPHVSGWDGPIGLMLRDLLALYAIRMVSAGGNGASTVGDGAS